METRGIKKKWLANKLKITQPNLNYWKESGRIPKVYLKKIRRIFKNV